MLLKKKHNIIVKLAQTKENQTSYKKNKSVQSLDEKTIKILKYVVGILIRLNLNFVPSMA